MNRARGADRQTPGEAWGWLAGVLTAGPVPAGTAAAGGAYWPLTLPDGRGYLFPLSGSAAALRLYNAHSLGARALKGCLAVGLATGILRPFLPRLALRLQGGRPEEGSACLLDHLQEILGRRDLRFALSLGTPGADRKPVVLALDPENRPLAYAKVGWNQATAELARNEAETLRRLEGRSFHSLRLPRLLHLGTWQGRLVCVQSAAPGKGGLLPRNPASGSLAALAELAGVSQRRMPLAESVYWKNLQQQAARLPEAERDLTEALGRLGALGDIPELPFHFCHGDFVPWNALALNGRLFLFDWEYSRELWPAGYDLFHYLVQTRLLLGRRPASRTYGSVLRLAWHSPPARVYWERLGVGQRAVRRLLLLYLLERLACWPEAASPALRALTRRCLAEEGLQP